MPRANRYFVPGLVWHLTHRCHERDFLLKFARDRNSYLHWLYEARKRFGLCVLDYMVTSNHVHLLVKDTAEGTIARGMQLIAGRSAQEYNRRKARLGAFWEDRYHATAIETGAHLHRCVVYIDLNMVRAGVVKHPAQWPHSGYQEIQHPPERYRVINVAALSEACGFEDISKFQKVHREWVETGSNGDTMTRDDRWSESVAVGSESFVERVRAALGFRAQHRQVAVVDGLSTLRERAQPYGDHFDRENEALRPNNAVPWQTNLEETKT
jgi:putative transposase